MRDKGTKKNRYNNTRGQKKNRLRSSRLQEKGFSIVKESQPKLYQL